jgi:hypothetical protein
MFLALGHVFLQPPEELDSNRFSFEEVSHFEFAGVELSNGQSHTVDAARRNNGDDTTSIGQA